MIKIKCILDAQEPNARPVPFNYHLPVSPRVEVPDSMLEGRTLPAWLRASVTALVASPVWYCRVVAVGELLRFDAFADRDIEFVRKLSPDTILEIKRVVATKIGELLERLEMNLFISSPGTAPYEARAITEERDQLESLLTVLWVAGRLDESVEVRILDTYASTWATTLDSIEGAYVPAVRGTGWWVENRRTAADTARHIASLVRRS